MSELATERQSILITKTQKAYLNRHGNASQAVRELIDEALEKIPKMTPEEFAAQLE